MPALFTRISILPYFSRTLSTASSTCFASVKAGHMPSTSHVTSSSRNLASALSTVSCLEPKSTTLAPFCRYFLTISKPIPRVPPVTIATLSFSNIRIPPLYLLFLYVNYIILHFKYAKPSRTYNIGKVLAFITLSI